MTLNEAIKHCKHKAQGDSECAKDHAQLAEWLTELKLRRVSKFADEIKQKEAVAKAVKERNTHKLKRKHNVS